MGNRSMVHLLKADGFYTEKNAKELHAVISSLPLVQTDFGLETQNFNFIQPALTPIINRVLGEKIVIDEESGGFKRPINIIHFDNFESVDEWRFVIALERSTFNLYFHNSGAKTALENYKLNYRNFLEWDYHTNILLEPGQGLFYRPWVFHSFENGLIQNFRLMSQKKEIEKKIILVMGLPGSGKTTLSTELSKELNATHLNADIIRQMYNDWDFSHEGRVRQSYRMRRLAEESITEYTIVDFVCPLVMSRDILSPDFIIWMNTIDKGRYEDTNKMFENPSKYDLEILDFAYRVKDIVDFIVNKNKESVDLI